jgi:hypothetical protein
LLKPDTSSAARLARSFKPDLSRPRQLLGQRQRQLVLATRAAFRR